MTAPTTAANSDPGPTISVQLPPRPYLKDYNRNLPASEQKSTVGIRVFLDACDVREKVFVHEQGACPVSHHLDTDDARAAHLVIYAPPPSTTTDPESESQQSGSIPVGTIRIVPYPDWPHPLPDSHFDPPPDDAEVEDASTFFFKSPPKYQVDKKTTLHDGAEPFLRFGRLCLLKEYRGKEYANLLIQEAVKWAKEHPNFAKDQLSDEEKEKIPEWKGLIGLHARKETVKVWERNGFAVDEGMGSWFEVKIRHVGMFRRVELDSTTGDMSEERESPEAEINPRTSYSETEDSQPKSAPGNSEAEPKEVRNLSGKRVKTRVEKSHLAEAVPEPPRQKTKRKSLSFTTSDEWYETGNKVKKSKSDNKSTKRKKRGTTEVQTPDEEIDEILPAVPDPPNAVADDFYKQDKPKRSIDDLGDFPIPVPKKKKSKKSRRTPATILERSAGMDTDTEFSTPVLSRMPGFSETPTLSSDEASGKSKRRKEKRSKRKESSEVATEENTITPQTPLEPPAAPAPEIETVLEDLREESTEVAQDVPETDNLTSEQNSSDIQARGEPAADEAAEPEAINISNEVVESPEAKSPGTDNEPESVPTEAMIVDDSPVVQDTVNESSSEQPTTASEEQIAGPILETSVNTGDVDTPPESLDSPESESAPLVEKSPALINEEQIPIINDEHIDEANSEGTGGKVEENTDQAHDDKPEGSNLPLTEEVSDSQGETPEASSEDATPTTVEETQDLPMDEEKASSEEPTTSSSEDSVESPIEEVPKESPESDVSVPTTIESTQEPSLEQESESQINENPSPIPGSSAELTSEDIKMEETPAEETPANAEGNQELPAGIEAGKSGGEEIPVPKDMDNPDTTSEEIQIETNETEGEPVHATDNEEIGSPQDEASPVPEREHLETEAPTVDSLPAATAVIEESDQSQEPNMSEKPESEDSATSEVLQDSPVVDKSEAQNPEGGDSPIDEIVQDISTAEESETQTEEATSPNEKTPSINGEFSSINEESPSLEEAASPPSENTPLEATDNSEIKADAEEQVSADTVEGEDIPKDEHRESSAEGTSSDPVLEEAPANPDDAPQPEPEETNTGVSEEAQSPVEEVQGAPTEMQQQEAPQEDTVPSETAEEVIVDKESSLAENIESIEEAQRSSQSEEENGETQSQPTIASPPTEVEASADSTPALEDSSAAETSSVNLESGSTDAANTRELPQSEPTDVEAEETQSEVVSEEAQILQEAATDTVSEHLAPEESSEKSEEVSVVTPEEPSAEEPASVPNDTAPENSSSDEESTLPPTLEATPSSEQDPVEETIPAPPIAQDETEQQPECTEPEHTSGTNPPTNVTKNTPVESVDSESDEDSDSESDESESESEESDDGEEEEQEDESTVDSEHTDSEESLHDENEEIQTINAQGDCKPEELAISEDIVSKDIAEENMADESKEVDIAASIDEFREENREIHADNEEPTTGEDLPVEESTQESSALGEADEMPTEGETDETSTKDVSPTTEESEIMQVEASAAPDEPGKSDSAHLETTQEAATECPPTETPISIELDHDKPAAEDIPAEPEVVVVAPASKFDVKSLVAKFEFSRMMPMGAKKPIAERWVEDVVESPVGRHSNSMPNSKLGNPMNNSTFGVPLQM
ncbi:hypothetical protein ACMFMF_005551 [Clarireedia jacksonii]